MKQERSPLMQMLSLLLYLFMLSLVSLLLLTLLEFFFYDYFGVFLGLTALQPLVIVFLLLFAIYRLVSSGLLQQIVAYIRHKWFGSSTTLNPMQVYTPIKVAQYSFKLYDPSEEDLFNKFLDSHVIRTVGQRPVTPAELLEEMTLEYVREIERKYGSMVKVRATLRRGSFEAVVQVVSIGVNTLLLIAAYHDIVESIQLFRSQVKGATRTVRSAYRRRTGKTMQVTDELDVPPPPTPQNQTERQTSAGRDGVNTARPVAVTNSYVPPPANSHMNISVNTANQKSSFGGCVNSCLLALLLVTLIVASFLFLFVDNDDRLVLLEEFVNYVGYLMRVVAHWLLQWANTIAPTFTEFY